MDTYIIWPLAFGVLTVAGVSIVVFLVLTHLGLHIPGRNNR
jgi:hypothetical protein